MLNTSSLLTISSRACLMGDCMSKDLRPCILYQFLHALVKSTTLKTLPFNRKQHFVLTSRIHLVIHKKMIRVFFSSLTSSRWSPFSWPGTCLLQKLNDNLDTNTQNHVCQIVSSDDKVWNLNWCKCNKTQSG